MKFYLFSLGCKVNGYENNAIREAFLKQGKQETTSPNEADIIVLNTCSVTSTADSKSRQHIRKFRKLAPAAIICVMGCYSELHAQKCLDMGANVVVGTSFREEIPSLINEFLLTHKSIAKVKSSVRHEKYEEMGTIAFSEQSRAYLKIQDGCDNFCSYCLIPTLRGNSRSRDPQEALLEAHRLVSLGYQEIIISGIHIGAYGKDLGDGSYRLPSLLKDILLENPTLARLRISSIEESEISEDLLALLRDYPSLVSHLHIPLQSGSSSVLKRMKRKYDTSAFLLTLKKIREIRPDIAITTDVIVGYPEESEEEWQETLAFCAKARFAEIHVFPFSSREGTLAASRPQLDPRIKERRVQELLALSKTLRKEYESHFYNQEVEVLFESFDKEKNLCYGHTGNYLLVSCPSKTPLHGQIKKVLYTPSSASD